MANSAAGVALAGFEYINFGMGNFLDNGAHVVSIGVLLSGGYLKAFQVAFGFQVAFEWCVLQTRHCGFLLKRKDCQQLASAL